MRTAHWLLGLAWLLAAPAGAQDAFRGCIATGWDCKAQAKHPERLGRPLVMPGLEGAYQAIAEAPSTPGTCEARLTAVTVRGAALLPAFPEVAVTAVQAPGLTGVAVRTGPVDEVWLCTATSTVVLVPWDRLASQVRLAKAVPGAMDPPATLPMAPITTEEDATGEMAVAAADAGTVRAMCRDGTRWAVAHGPEVCEGHGGVVAWLIPSQDGLDAPADGTPADGASPDLPASGPEVDPASPGSAPEPPGLADHG